MSGSARAASDQGGATNLPGMSNDTVVKGRIGNAVFYLFVLAMFVLLKAMGITERLWQAMVARIGG